MERRRLTSKTGGSARKIEIKQFLVNPAGVN